MSTGAHQVGVAENEHHKRVRGYHEPRRHRKHAHVVDVQRVPDALPQALAKRSPEADRAMPVKIMVAAHAKETIRFLDNFG